MAETGQAATVSGAFGKATAKPYIKPTGKDFCLVSRLITPCHGESRSFPSWQVTSCYSTTEATTVATTINYAMPIWGFPYRFIRDHSSA